MSALERIKNILYSDNLEFFMYRGGGGGDRLMALVYEYSEKYKNNSIKILTSELENNKHHVEYPHILKIFADLYPAAKTLFPPEIFILNILIKQQLHIEEEIAAAEDFLKENQILRLHRNYNDIFKNRTVFQFLDSPDWFDYAGLLAQFKLKISVSDLFSYAENLRTRMKYIENYSLTDIQELYNSLIEQNITKISTITLQALNNKLIKDKYTIKGLSMLSTADLYYIYHTVGTNPHGKWEEHAKYAKDTTHCFNVYNFSESLKSNRLNDIYEINDPAFNEKLLEWHENNLELLSINNVNCSPYVIH